MMLRWDTLVVAGRPSVDLNFVTSSLIQGGIDGILFF